MCEYFWLNCKGERLIIGSVAGMWRQEYNLNPRITWQLHIAHYVVDLIRLVSPGNDVLIYTCSDYMGEILG
jgi:hypothetical protein